MTDQIPDIALSIMQPWTFLCAGGWKDIENRDWKPWNPGLKFRGPVALHAGRNADRGALAELTAGRHPVTGEPLAAQIVEAFARGMPLGGIVGVAEIVGVVSESDSQWFVGPYGLVLRNARPVPFVPCLGALGFFHWRDREAMPLEARPKPTPAQGRLF